MNRSKSTISRELRRNAAPAGQPMSYCPLTAHALYKQRREACRPHKRLAYAPLHAYIQTCIVEYHWSPEEIVGRSQLEHGCRLVSVPTIYRAIHAGLLNPPGASAKFVLRKLRRHKNGNEEHRGKFVISHPIEDCPASAANRSVRGHWEADTVVGKQGKACLVTLVDRKSRYLPGGKAMSKTAAAVNKVMGEALSGQPHLSVTPDRGKEFSKHAQLRNSERS
nr:IS30 family transposase [Mitsuokella multacida]